jgi:hypothetical protein
VTWGVEAINPGGRSLQRGVNTTRGGKLLDDIVVVSSGVLGLGDVESSPSDEESEGVRLVMTGRDEGTTAEGDADDDEGCGGVTTDGVVGMGSMIGQGGRFFCLLARDLQDHSGSRAGSLPFLAGRVNQPPKSARTVDGRCIIIVPERSPSYTEGEGK